MNRCTGVFVIASIFTMSVMSGEMKISRSSITNELSVFFSDDKTSETYERSKDKLVVVTVDNDDGRQWSGSGFIIKGNKDKWLVTNRHVIDSPGRISARLIAGGQIELGDMVVAENRDIVRFKVDSSLPALDIDLQEPTFGDEIEIYGNSDGLGVVTRITGKVRGIGPEFVEVDAQFVSGNSGSPIVRVSSGKVIGIATETKHKKHDNDAAYSRTRFNDVRWFGVRFHGVKWNNIGKTHFMQQVKALDEISKYYTMIRKVCFDGQWFRMDDYREMERFETYSLLNRVFRAIAEKDEQLFELGERLYEMEMKNLALEGGVQDARAWRERSLNDAIQWINEFDNGMVYGGKYARPKQGAKYATQKVGRGSIEWVSQTTIDGAKKHIGRVYLEGTKRRYSALMDGRNLLESEKWCTQEFKDRVEAYKKIINADIRKYKEMNRRQLKKAGIRIR